mmetsp:Transcript_14933/g.40972  ORF Transcript_14933/g.40972 Transcript_14933/m.40972 type:complete len:211 (+) Transcript_14933:1062-1694(+)
MAISLWLQRRVAKISCTNASCASGGGASCGANSGSGSGAASGAASGAGAGAGAGAIVSGTGAGIGAGSGAGSAAAAFKRSVRAASTVPCLLSASRTCWSVTLLSMMDKTCASMASGASASWCSGACARPFSTSPGTASLSGASSAGMGTSPLQMRATASCASFLVSRSAASACALGNPMASSISIASVTIPESANSRRPTRESFAPERLP